MRTKKIIAFTLLFVLLFSSVCIAYGHTAFSPEPNRWIEFSSDDTGQMFYDKKSIQQQDFGVYSVWIMIVPHNEPFYTMFRINIKSDRTCLMKELINYDIVTREMLNSDMQPDTNYTPIPPDSRLEVLYDILFPQ